MAVKSDKVATGLSTGPGGVKRRNRKQPLVTFTGWVIHERGKRKLRLLQDSWCDEWLEIPVKSVVLQVPGNKRRDEGRSVLWVKRSAKVTRCHRATAGAFADAALDGIVDPAGNGYGGSSGKKP